MTMKCCYIWETSLLEECDRLPAVPKRASLVHNLITAYGLLDKVKIIRSVPAEYEDLKLFHSPFYIDHLKTFTEIDDDYMTKDIDEEFGIVIIDLKLGYDCPPVSDMYRLVSVIAGGSVTAAQSLILGIADIAINWCGGWHHAQRNGAEGFCYINDIVICIEKLSQKFHKILYIDLDVHHGNGVQNAFMLSKKVFTLSFHKYEPGFFPGTGAIDEVGIVAGKGFTCNVPLHAFYNDDSFEYIFERVFTNVYDSFKPDAMVLQCGADTLAGDPNGGASLTLQGYCKCVRKVLEKRKPTVLLGGGGYHHSNTARLWTSITALAANVELDHQIPEHEYWPQYGPSYELSVQPSLAKDQNTRNYLDDCIRKITENLEKYIIESENENMRDTNSKKIENSLSHKRPKVLLGASTPSNQESNRNIASEEVSRNNMYEFID